MDGTEWPLAHDYIATEAAARGFEVTELPITTGYDLEATFARIRTLKPQALYVGYSQLTLYEAGRIVEFANRSALPSVFNSGAHVTYGGTLSYGPDIFVLFERAAAYVDKVLRGTLPTDPPIELPTKYDLWVNVKAAKSIGVEIPKSLLVRADRVID